MQAYAKGINAKIKIKIPIVVVGLLWHLPLHCLKNKKGKQAGRKWRARTVHAVCVAERNRCRHKAGRYPPAWEEKC